ncbi:MAG TPA: TetR/AcrR family transcriptional regulator [Burkholderiaceae bacterium]|nr:TetR/AcrR family transcriptional regulator [Burkholderiaceae bacterium]
MTVTKPPKGRQARLLELRETTRRAILDAALDLFVSEGYGQASIRNIAARVEYSPGAIYGYFASKDEIFYALAEEGLRSLGARELADAPSADALDDLRASIWRLYEFSTEQPQYFALVFLDRHVPRVSKDYERFAFISDMRNRALARVERCIAEGLFPETTHAEVALRLLWAPVVGFAALRLSHRIPDGVAIDPLVRDSIETTIAGIRAGAPRHARPLDVAS